MIKSIRTTLPAGNSTTFYIRESFLNEFVYFFSSNTENIDVKIYDKKEKLITDCNIISLAEKINIENFKIKCEQDEVFKVIFTNNSASSVNIVLSYLF